MTAPSGTLEGLVLLTATFALVLTILTSPLLVAAFRRRVTVSMNTASPGAAPAEPAVADQTPNTTAGPQDLFVPLNSSADLAKAAAADDLLTLARRKLRRVAAAYAAGGLAHATVCSLFFLASFGSDFLQSPALYTPVFLAMALPVVPTAAYVLGLRPAALVGWTVAGVLVALLLAGRGRSLFVSVAQLHLLIPALVFLLFNLRYWRSVAPLVLTLAAGGSLAWLLGLQLGRAVVGVDSPAIWLFRIGGFALGCCLAFYAVRLIGARYRAKATSDQELFLDGWWAVFTVIQAAVLMIRPENPSVSALMLLSLTAFPAYYLTRRALLRLMRADEPPQPVALLLLRVFGHDRRTERLLDGITRGWRHIGPVYLIAGPDVALRTIDPQDFYSFLSGQLSRAFVKDDADLGARLDALDRAPDPDGRYRINQFFCHQNTWKSVLDALVRRSAAVLMDLRGFDAARVGCRYELTRLGEHLGEKPVVLLVDGSTDRDLVAVLLRQGQAVLAPNSGSPERRAYLLDAGPKAGARLLGLATRLLLGAQPGLPARA
jgi:hypothetical protein